MKKRSKRRALLCVEELGRRELLATTAAYFPLPSGRDVNLTAEGLQYWENSSRDAKILVNVLNPHRERGGFTIRLYWEDASGRRTPATKADKQAFKATTPVWGPKTGVGVEFKRGELTPRPKDARALVAVVDPGNQTRETIESDNTISFKLPSPVILSGTRATSVGFRGRIINGTFSPNGADTKSQDKRASEGALTAAQETSYAALLQAFLRGETNGNYITGSPAEKDKKAIIDPFASRFLKGTGGTFTHRAGSALSTLVRSSSEFGTLHATFREYVQKTLQSQADRGTIDFGALDVSRYVNDRSHDLYFSPYNRSTPFTLRAVLGGTQAIRITVKMTSVKPTVKPTGGGSIDYRADVRYEIFDVFGAGDGDKYIAALKAMWQLQHRGARARPFSTQVVVEETISGTIRVPSRYDIVKVNS